MTDQAFDACMQRICSGDKDGLKEIYEAYLAYIFPLILGIVKNRQDAEDVTSSFFLRLWNTAEQYKPGRGHKTYITTIARNMSIDFLRKNNRAIPMDLSGEDEETENALHETETVGFEDHVVEEMTLKEALNTLKDTEREIIHMKIACELTFKEIAEILKLPMGTVTWRYREALKKLRRYGYE